MLVGSGSFQGQRGLVFQSEHFVITVVYVQIYKYVEDKLSYRWAPSSCERSGEGWATRQAGCAVPYQPCYGNFAQQCECCAAHR